MFVGRSREFAVLRDAFSQTLAGESRLVLVAGEAGIGKTELARAFARQARGQGALVLWGSAWEDGGAPPYWPWVQILRNYGRQAGSAALAQAAGRDAGVLGQLLPELGAADEPGGSGDGARFALFEAVCAALDRASQPTPLVLVLDDVHAAGRPSALLLRFAAAAPLSRILLIATYRAAEARLDSDTGDVISALETAGTLLTLEGLSPDEIQAMLPGAGADVLAAVQRRSEGNPLFVSQVARLLGRDAADVEDVPVPAGIRQAIRRQLTRLDTRPLVSGQGTADGGAVARQVLATASALGPEADPALVAAALDMPPEPVAALFDGAVEAGLLRAGPGPGGRYRFGHALIREALYSELPPRARADTHRRIAAELEKQPWRSRAGHAELAYHFLRAGSAGRTVPAAAVEYACLAGEDALGALAYEEAAGHYQRALDALGRTASATPARRCELLLGLAAAMTRTGPDPAAARVTDEAARLARQAGQPRLLATAALLSAQYLDFNAPADAVIALLREAAERLEADDHALRARTLARLAIALAPDPGAARAAAQQAVESAQVAVARAAPVGQKTPSSRPARAPQAAPDDRAADSALAVSLLAQQHVLWGTQEPSEALAAASEIVAAARCAHEPDAELDGHVLRLTHLLELGDGPASRRVLPELDRIAEFQRQPAARLVALSRRSTLAALTGDFPEAARLARQAWEAGQAARLPDAGAVYWGQLFAIWLHAGLPGADERWMEDELRQLAGRSHLSVAHAAALVQIDAAKAATEQAHGRLDELVADGMKNLRPDMVYVWALAQLARACCILGAAHHAAPLYRALAPYSGRAAVAAGAVMCAGSTDFYLAGLAAMLGEIKTADRHYRAAVSCHRRLGARPMLARTLHEHALLLQEGRPGDTGAAPAALAEARAIATECGMTKLLAALGQPREPAPGTLALTRDGDYWLLSYAGMLVRLPDSLGLRYLDLLVRNPGRELPAAELVQLAGATGAASAPAQADDLHQVTAMGADDVLDPRAREEYRRRLAELDQELAEAQQWNDTERASRLRAEKDFLVHELTAATGLGGRPRHLGSEAERARVNATRAIRSAISRIRDRAPDAAAHLDQAVRTGSRCSYTARTPVSAAGER